MDSGIDYCSFSFRSIQIYYTDFHLYSYGRLKKKSGALELSREQSQPINR